MQNNTRKKYHPRVDQLMGGNTFTSVAGSGGDQFLGYFRALERIEAEMQRVRDRRSAILAEMSALGFDRPALLSVIKRRRERKLGVLEDSLSPPPPKRREAVELYETIILDAIHRNAL